VSQQASKPRHEVFLNGLVSDINALIICRLFNRSRKIRMRLAEARTCLHRSLASHAVSATLIYFGLGVSKHSHARLVRQHNAAMGQNWK